MARIKAFKGVRPAANLTAQVASKPYDVLNSAEARIEVANNPNSFLHIIKSEVDLPEDIDTHSIEVYEKAKENFERFIADGILIQDAEDAVYVYRLTMDGRSQIGIVAASSVQDYFDNVIKKHEFTRPVKEKDRIDHMRTTGIHSGPVFLTYNDVASIDETVNAVIANNSADADFESDDVRHELWVVNDPAVVASIVQDFATQVPSTYIADGHHRAASSAKVGHEISEDPNAEHNFFLSVLFPASQLMIIDYNRVVKDLNGLSKEEFINKVSEKFDISDGEMKHPANFHDFGMYIDGKWYKLTAKEGSFNANDPIDVLDVAILQNNVLSGILDIHDPRTDDRVDFVGGIRGLGELVKRVDSGEMAAAFSLYPVSIEQLIRISDTGNVMPPKSTWFEPKLKSGLVIHKLS